MPSASARSARSTMRGILASSQVCSCGRRISTTTSSSVRPSGFAGRSDSAAAVLVGAWLSAWLAARLTKGCSSAVSAWPSPVSESAVGAGLSAPRSAVSGGADAKGSVCPLPSSACGAGHSVCACADILPRLAASASRELSTSVVGCAAALCCCWDAGSLGACGISTPPRCWPASMPDCDGDGETWA